MAYNSRVALHPWCLPSPQNQSSDLADIMCAEQDVGPSLECTVMPNMPSRLFASNPVARQPLLVRASGAGRQRRGPMLGQAKRLGKGSLTRRWLNSTHHDLSERRDHTCAIAWKSKTSRRCGSKLALKTPSCVRTFAGCQSAIMSCLRSGVAGTPPARLWQSASPPFAAAHFGGSWPNLLAPARPGGGPAPASPSARPIFTPCPKGGPVMRNDLLALAQKGLRSTDVNSLLRLYDQVRAISSHSPSMQERARAEKAVQRIADE